MKVDYIIVGLGLAGISFAEQLLKHNKSFVVFEDDSQTSSLVAGGVYNPVILKRFTPVWRAKEQLAKALPFYRGLEERFGVQLDQQFSTKKVFKSIEDQNNWFHAADKPLLSDYMNPEIIQEEVNGIIASHGFGEILQTGRIDTGALVNTYRNFLKSYDSIRFEQFNYSKLNISEHQLSYQDIFASKIVFCEGYGMHLNPFFNHLPLNEAKGELLTIHAPDLNIDFLAKSTLFVLPLGDHLYKVGATFNWKDKTSIPSVEGKEELVEKLKKVIDVPYTIVDQTAGIRPTVKDRRPLLGKHKQYTNLILFNGLGTRGVMIAPWAAELLYQHIESDIPLENELSIERFD